MYQIKKYTKRIFCKEILKTYRNGNETENRNAHYGDNNNEEFIKVYPKKNFCCRDDGFLTGCPKDMEEEFYYDEKETSLHGRCKLVSRQIFSKVQKRDI